MAGRQPVDPPTLPTTQTGGGILMAFVRGLLSPTGLRDGLARRSPKD